MNRPTPGENVSNFARLLSEEGRNIHILYEIH